MRKFDAKSFMKVKTPKAAKAALAAVAVIFAVIMLTGCVNFLESEKLVVTMHQSEPYVRPPVETITISDYDELVAVVLDAIVQYKTEIHLLYNHRDGYDIREDFIRLRDEMIYEHPIGAFMVAEITSTPTRIVTHHEVDIEIEYKRTQEQLESIIGVPMEQSIRIQLLRIMSDYSEVAVFRTRLQLNEEIILRFVKDTYYQNPRNIVMLPIITVEAFPQVGPDRVYEIHFGYMESIRMLQQFSGLLALNIQQNAELAVGETDSETLLNLVNNLRETTSFDEATARSIHAHGLQNFAATASGALIRGNAVGEGFAMAFKALADELGIYCRVVLGELDGMVHAWNIVLLYGDYYHIDVAMCRVLGLEEAFLKSDTDFEQRLYVWDRENTVRCEGDLTLEDLLGNNNLDELDDEEEDD